MGPVAASLKVKTLNDSPYNIRFQYMGGYDTNDRYTFRFKSGDSIGQVLDIISAIVDGFEYDLEGDVCTVRISN